MCKQCFILSTWSVCMYYVLGHTLKCKEPRLRSVIVDIVHIKMLINT